MAKPAKGFADRLRRAREAAGISSAELGRRTGLSKQTLSDLEAGKWYPNWLVVQKLAAALGVSCEAFVDPELAGEPAKSPAAKRPAGKQKPRGKGK
jgi:transcriptional regulator with XRE-family HTH domain